MTEGVVDPPDGGWKEYMKNKVHYKPFFEKDRKDFFGSGRIEKLQEDPSVLAG